MKIQGLTVEIFLRDEKDATTAGYAIMVALVTTAIVLIVFFVGLQVQEAFNKFCTLIVNRVGGACS